MGLWGNSGLNTLPKATSAHGPEDSTLPPEPQPLHMQLYIHQKHIAVNGGYNKDLAQCVWSDFSDEMIRKPLQRTNT